MTTNDPLEILIVDDEEQNRDFMSSIVESEGWGFRLAVDGESALEALRERRPNLVLLDIMMPGKNGLRVFTEMKEDAELSGIPIIFVTATSAVTGVDINTGEVHTASESSVLGEAYQAIGERIHRRISELKPDAVVEKPIDPPVLVAAIKRALSA